MIKDKILRNFVPRLLSPVGLLLQVSFSYVWLISSKEFPSNDMAINLLILGAQSLIFGAWIISYRFNTFIISTLFANRLLNTSLVTLSLLSTALYFVTGSSFKALVDDRFSIPAYGLVYGLYFVCALVVAATWRQQNARYRKAVFFLPLFFVGYIAGGKGFLLPFIFGLSLAQLIGLNQISYRWFIGLAVMTGLGAAFAVYSLVDDLDGVLLILGTRIALAADAVLWLSKMSNSEILEFPISAWQVVFDLLSRWVGIRMTQGAVGSIMAATVSGDDAGGGPNPLLPVMAYLVNHGNLVASIIFVTIMIFLLWVFLFLTGKWLLKTSEGKFFHAVLTFLSPLFLIDVFLYWQFVVCLTFLGVLCIPIKWLSATLRPLSMSQSSRS